MYRQHLTVMSGRNFKKDLERIRSFSHRIEERLDSSKDPRIDSLTSEQLQDLGEVLRLAEYMMTKYEDKKDFRDILEEFVAMINSSAGSMQQVDDDIEELIMSAEQSILRIKETQTRVAKNVNFGSPQQAEDRHESTDTASNIV